LEELAKEQGIDLSPDPEFADEEPGSGDAPGETESLDDDDTPRGNAEESPNPLADDEDAEPGPGADDARAVSR
jgi:hypothetical protein